MNPVSRHSLLAVLVGAVLCASLSARAATLVSTDESTFLLGGDVKAFFTGIFPYDHFLNIFA